MITLDRPIVYFDLETTGTDIVFDRIVSICVQKLHPDGTLDPPRSRLINPGMRIPDSATAIHGITNEMVSNAPVFSSIAASLYKIFDGCHVAGHNIFRFDVPMLAEHFLRCSIIYQFPLKGCKIFDTQAIHTKAEPRTLVALALKYLNKDISQSAHDAEVDTVTAGELLQAMFTKHIDQFNDLNGFAEASIQDRRVDLAGKIERDDKGDYRYTFGKHRGERVRDFPGFAKWMLEPEQTFSIQTKEVVKTILWELGK